MRMTRSLSWGLFALIGLSSSLYANPAATVAELELAPATVQVIASEQVVDALIEAVHQSTVSSQTSGRIVEVLVDVDDTVEKGDVLVRFRDLEQRANLRAAEARASEAKANFDRVKDLVERQLVPKAEFDRAEAALKSANAAVDQAREQLEHTVVRAPYSGIVMERHVQPGETASPGQRLMTGLSLESLRAIADVPQRHIDQVRKIARARITLPTQDGLSVGSTGLTFSPYADPVTHTFRVRVELPQGQYGIYPGMFVKVAFVVGEQQRLVVPASAVVYRGEVTAVYVVRDEQIFFRQVRTGRVLEDGHVEVFAGLSEGEQLAIDPILAGVLLKASRTGGGA
ncbi:MAG: efflux RND transporter periplasmic adaptor subunit [Thiohalomonadaceae bacterium]